MALALLPRLAGAQPVRPWTPASSDSVVAWAAEARTRFQTNVGDSIGGANYRAYEIVGGLGRRLLRALGKANGAQAHQIEAVLDSLGLDTEVAFDPRLPAFTLLVVHNPYRPAAASVGFLYWYRQNDLRMQGVYFRGGRNVLTRVWWTGRKETPYHWAIVDHDPIHAGPMRLLLFRLDPEGYSWSLHQYEGNGPDLGGPGEAQWADLDHDNRPELVTWVPAPLDSAFETCSDCPKLYSERTYVERQTGYELQDSRLMPSPLTTFVLFVRFLRDKNLTAARRLLADPGKLDEAVALGWGRRGRKVWSLEYTESGEAWPRWLAFRFRREGGDARYIVHFTMEDGRWIIREWLPIQKSAEGSARTEKSPTPEVAKPRVRGGVSAGDSSSTPKPERTGGSTPEAPRRSR